MEFVPSEKWGYLMKPSQTVFSYGQPVKINTAGLRGAEIKKHKVKGGLRLLFVGDSITYGGGRIREDQLFSRIVEASLNRDGVPAEIINLSAPGWGPQNWMKYIESNGLYDSDFVVLVLPETDLDRAFSTWDAVDFKETAPLLRLHTSFIKIYSIIRQTFRSQNIHPTNGSISLSNNDVKANLDAVLDLIYKSHAEDIRLLVIFIPSVPTSASVIYWPQFEAIVSETLDLRDTLNDANYFMDTIHLNVKGHKLVGEAITDRIKEFFVHASDTEQTAQRLIR
jgi:lysophospholipase L1-like esterase